MPNDGSVLSMSLASDLHLQFGNSPLQAKQLLLECCFLSLKRSNLLLYPAVLGLLEIKMPLPK